LRCEADYGAPSGERGNGANERMLALAFAPR
jgi:hypothetical protein